MSTGAARQLFILGAFRLVHGGAEVHVARRKVASLLAYLVLHPAKHSRDSLAALFWGDYPDSTARRSPDNSR
jgi:DNA-binding SARP family transcriptional activator